MLARTFLTADQLNIPQDWYDALLKVLHAMERGELRHVSENEIEYYHPAPSSFSGLFNMGEWQTNCNCGTVCCIGGSAELLGNVEINEHRECYTDALDDLFYPKVWTRYDTITVEQAQEALRRYLTIGSPQWEHVLIGSVPL